MQTLLPENRQKSRKAYLRPYIVECLCFCSITILQFKNYQDFFCLFDYFLWIKPMSVVLLSYIPNPFCVLF